jgi:hypothetical protein
MADEISIEQFIEAIHKLPEDEPRDDPRVWYRTQKQHWLGWLQEYHGPGAYGRAASQRRNARFAYNHVVNPQLLLYLIKAAGVEPRRMKAADEAAARGTTMMQQSGAIRKQVPWDVVREALWGS